MVQAGARQREAWINWDGLEDQWSDLLREGVEDYRSQHVQSIDELPKRQRDRLTGADVTPRRNRPRGMRQDIVDRIRAGGKTGGK